MAEPRPAPRRKPIPTKPLPRAPPPAPDPAPAPAPPPPAAPASPPPSPPPPPPPKAEPPKRRKAPAPPAPAPAPAEPEGDIASSAIAVRGLRRSYGAKVALDGATFTVARGEVFGFLGPNGAGKTTTIRILTGLLRPSSGEAYVYGARMTPDAPDAKAHLGYVPDEPRFPARIKALPLLVAYARFYGIPREDAERRGKDLLQQVGLEGQERAVLRSFSHGMGKRFALAQALLHDPPVLIMDEPSSGLDPAGTAWFREVVRSLKGEGKTIFLSSHLLHEVQQVCDRVGIIHGGRIQAVGSIGNLGQRVSPRVEVLAVASGLGEEAVQAVQGLRGVLAVHREADRLRVEATDEEVAADVNAALVRHGARVRRLESTQPSLEDIYLALTHKAGGEEA